MLLCDQRHNLVALAAKGASRRGNREGRDFKTKCARQCDEQSSPHHTTSPRVSRATMQRGRGPVPGAPATRLLLTEGLAFAEHTLAVVKFRVDSAESEEALVPTIEE